MAFLCFCAPAPSGRALAAASASRSGARLRRRSGGAPLGEGRREVHWWAVRPRIRISLSLLLIAAVVACGRLDYADVEVADGGEVADEPVALVPAGTLANAPYAIAPRVDGPGVVVAYAEFPLGSTTANLVMVKTAADGAVYGAPVIITGLDLQLDFLYLFAEAGGYRLFHVPLGTSDLVITAIDADGRVLSTASLNGRRHLYVTAIDGGYALSFKQGNAPTQVYFELLDQSGVPVGVPIALESTAENQDYALVAQSGDGFGVLWRDQRSGSRRVRFMTADSTPAVVGTSAEPFPVAGVQRPVALVDDGAGGFIAAVDNDHGVLVRRLDGAGAPVWSETVSLPPNRRDSPDLSLQRVGDRLGIAWQGDNETLTQIYFTTMAVADGSVGSIQELSAGQSRAGDPKLTYVDERFVTVFHEDDGERAGPFLRWSTP